MDETSCFKVVKLSKFLDDIESSILAGCDQKSIPGHKRLKKDVNDFFRNYSTSHFNTSVDFMNKFIWDDVLHEESSGVSRTYLFMNSDESVFYAFFTIRLDTVILEHLDNDIRKKLVLNKKMNAVEHIKSIPAHLIEEVAKNTNIVNNPIHMHQIVEYALSIIIDSQALIGGKLVVLNSVNEVVPLYEKEGFTKFGTVTSSSYDKDSKYQPMYLKME